MADVTSGVAFVGVSPCRLVDTRATSGFPAGFGPPSLVAGSPRTFDLNSAAHCPGIPAPVDAYSLNITVTNTQGPGFILIYPESGIQPTVSTLNYVANQTVANAAIVPAGPGGPVVVVAGVSGTDLLIDINGYFTDVYNADNQFFAVSNTALPAIRSINQSGQEFAVAIRGEIYGPAGGASAALRGANYGTGSAGVGVWGSQNGSGWGVFGESASGGYGVYGRTAGSPPGTFSSAGVRGETAGTGIGVLGLTNNGYSGVSGYRVTGGGGVGAGADLGYSATVGLNVTGSTQASGVKNFVEPHPTDASKVIRYSSLEGNEVGTYFRGRGRFQNGIAVIEVPEDFRIVSDAEGLSIQVTPIGQMATVAVEAIGLDRIVVRGSRNVDFFYTVNGIRRAYKDLPVIDVNDKVFIPQSADARLPEYLPESLRERLVSNGTYAPDGTVNRETARRLGWERIWAERSRPEAQPIP